MDEPKRTLKQKAYQGFKEYVVISCYLWLVFGLLVVYKSVLVSEQHTFVAHGVALFNALALGKVMLVAQELHFADYFKEKPLIYPILFKSIAFAVVLGCFKILEETLIGLYHGQSFTASIAGIGGGTLKGILSLVAIVAVLLVPFFGFTELNKVLSDFEWRKVFFESRHPYGHSLTSP